MVRGKTRGTGGEEMQAEEQLKVDEVVKHLQSHKTLVHHVNNIFELFVLTHKKWRDQYKSLCAN